MSVAMALALFGVVVIVVIDRTLVVRMGGAREGLLDGNR